MDFGISKAVDTAPGDALTEPSRLVGSLYHMAPEQLAGTQIDARTDVWALGVLLFEMLTGRKPFREGAWPLFCAQVLNESAPELEALGANIPDDVRAAIRKCLCRLPQERFGNVAELAVALMPSGSLSAELLSPSSPPPTPPRPPPASAAQAVAAVPLAMPEPSPVAGPSEAPVSSDRPAKARGARDLWALGAVLGSVLLAALGVQLFGHEPTVVRARASGRSPSPIRPSPRRRHSRPLRSSMRCPRA